MHFDVDESQIKPNDESQSNELAQLRPSLKLDTFRNYLYNY